MKKAIFVAYLLIFGIILDAKTQITDLYFYLINEQTQFPVDGAHVFLSNTTFGTISNKNGQVQLDLPLSMGEDLLITHVAYDTRVLTATQYKNIQKGDTVWLQPNKINVAEIVISEKRNNKWKKNFNKFQKAFLGQDEAAQKCEILNPEVLRFHEENGLFTTTAIDLLNIRNDYLGYDVQYLLRTLTIKADGSIDYLGQAKFKAIDDQKKIQKNRKETYLSSPKHFFYSLLNDQLEENGYDIAMEIYQNGQFIPFMEAKATRLIKNTPDSNIYHVQFNEFLKVIHKKEVSVSYSKIGVRSGGLESQKFSGSRTDSKENIQHPVSYLYKITPHIELNIFGNVLNSKMVKEYGFWANQRFARQLPFDYGNDYQLEKKETKRTPLAEKIITNNASNYQLETEQFNLFKTLARSTDQPTQQRILEQLDKNWKETHIPALVEILGWSRNDWLQGNIRQLLAKKTKESVQKGYYEWLQWLWKRPAIYGNYYANLKAELYSKIDPKFYAYFNNQQENTLIRLDEIVWGGVKQDGIPPLRNPKMIAANEATYLADDNVVFGFYVNGMARAYPKRILAWHEFFSDNFGNLEIAGVYCTLCGTVIAYDRVHENTLYDLGTSGFLYRSNKLMYDQATQSLWNTIEGKPVVGKLAEENIELRTYPIVTTTWGEWKNTHPNTEVLSLETGYQRNYVEGEAYRDYFSSDRLMFPVPEINSKLPNKAEVFVIRAEGYENDPLAIDINYLKKKKLYQAKIGETNILVLSDKTGTARAYDLGEIQFISYQKGQLKDKNGKLWTITEDALLLENAPQLARLPAHRIFWFAWFNVYPETRLVK